MDESKFTNFLKSLTDFKPVNWSSPTGSLESSEIKNIHFFTLSFLSTFPERGRIISANLLRCLRVQLMAGVAATCACFWYRYPRRCLLIPNKNEVSILKTGACRRNTRLRHWVINHLSKLADFIRPLWYNSETPQPSPNPF